MGARMHYAVPRLLHQHGLLSRFYADICAVRGWPAVLPHLPRRILPAALRRLSARVPEGIPRSLIVAFTAFGLEYQRRRSSAHSVSELTSVHLWAGKTFNELILSARPPQNTSLYCFNSAGLELLQAWGDRNLTMIEQTIAPRRVEERILMEQEEAFPGWQAPLPKDANVDAYMVREEMEWRAARVIVCGSEFVRNGIRECGGPVDRCVVVPYGIALRDYAVGDRRPPNGRPLRVLTVGEVGLRKGTHQVLAVAKKLKGRAEFRLAGTMGLLPQREEELRRQVEWVGVVPRHEIADHFRWADVFLLPSWCEGSATATYEALAAGLPVLTTPNAGSIVEDQLSGFIVAAGDVASIVERLERFLSRPALLSDMSQAALQRSRFGTLEAYAARLMNAIQQGQANMANSFVPL